MQSGPRSGKHGAVKYGSGGGAFLTSIRNWIYNSTSTPEDYVHSGTRGAHDRAGGVWDSNGTFEQFGAIPVLFPGDSFDFYGFAGPDTGVFGTNGNTIVGPVLLDSLTINWDWNPNGRLSMSSTFSANGCFDEENSNDIVETPAFCPTRMCDLSIWVKRVCDEDGPGSGSGSGSGNVGPYKLDNVLTASLNFTADNQTVVNSSTLCCTERRPGNVDATFSLVDQDNYIQFGKDDIYIIYAYVTATLYWEIAWMQYTGTDNYNVNLETGAVISKNNNFSFKGLLCCGAASPTLGYIHSPGAVVRWPIAAS